MDDLNEIKYKLEKISTIQNGHISGWESKQKNLNTRRENNEKLNDRERNPFLAVGGGAIPIFLTLYSFELLALKTLFELIIIDIVIMIGIFTFYGIYNFKNSDIFIHIEEEVMQNILNMETLKNHIDNTSFDITQFNNDNLEIIYAITKITQGDSNIRYNNILKKSIKSRLLQPQAKSEFNEIVNNAKELILEEIEYYKKVEIKITKPEWKTFSHLYETLKKESEFR